MRAVHQEPPVMHHIPAEENIKCHHVMPCCVQSNEKQGRERLVLRGRSQSKAGPFDMLAKGSMLARLGGGMK